MICRVLGCHIDSLSCVFAPKFDPDHFCVQIYMEEHGEVAGDVLAHFGDNLEHARKALEENYNGCDNSLADYAEELTTETSEVPEHLVFYIDYEKMGRDMELSGEVFTAETGYQEVHVFWSH